MKPPAEITSEECRRLMGDFAAGGEPVVGAWLHGFEAGFKRGVQAALDEIGARPLLDAARRQKP